MAPSADPSTSDAAAPSAEPSAVPSPVPTSGATPDTQSSPAGTGPSATSPPPIVTSSGPTAGPSASQPRGNATACGDVHFDASSDNAAWEISATGVSCADAVALVKRVAQEHNFVSGPRQFTTDGWACTVTTTEDGMPQGAYGCRKGAALVSWDKT